MKVFLAASILFATIGLADAKPANHSASKPTAHHQVAIGKMQTNPKAWNYGMIHRQAGWEVTPKSGWYHFLNNLLSFAAALPGLPASHGSSGAPHSTGSVSASVDEHRSGDRHPTNRD